jgi:hypothetical protein
MSTPPSSRQNIEQVWEIIQDLQQGIAGTTTFPDLAEAITISRTLTITRDNSFWLRFVSA